MRKPNSEDPDKFRAVLRLTKMTDNDVIEIAEDPIEPVRVKIPQPKPQLTKLELWEQEGRTQATEYLRSISLSENEIRLKVLEIERRLINESIRENERRYQEAYSSLDLAGLEEPGMDTPSLDSLISVGSLLLNLGLGKSGIDM